jgi:hypothetical protein
MHKILLPKINDAVSRCPCFFTLAAPNQFWFGDRNPALLCTDIQTLQTADLETNIQSGLLFADQSVYFHISTSDEIVTQWNLPTRVLNFSISYGKIMTSQSSQ